MTEKSVNVHVEWHDKERSPLYTTLDKNSPAIRFGSHDSETEVIFKTGEGTRVVHSNGYGPEELHTPFSQTSKNELSDVTIFVEPL